jgi:hypothetical protein
MTAEYTFVSPERQNESTRRLQKRLVEAAEPPEVPETGEISGATAEALTFLINCH